MTPTQLETCRGLLGDIFNVVGDKNWDYPTTASEAYARMAQLGDWFECQAMPHYAEAARWVVEFRRRPLYTVYDVYLWGHYNFSENFFYVYRSRLPRLLVKSLTGFKVEIDSSHAATRSTPDPFIAWLSLFDGWHHLRTGMMDSASLALFDAQQAMELFDRELQECRRAWYAKLS